MSSNEQNNTTEIRYATVANSGSGNVFYHGGFVPTPTIPINGSNLPNPHPHFVGREDKIQEVMNALSSRAWIIGIDGMGGIGKTTLALEVAHLCKRHDSNYPEVPHFTGYVWVSARNKLNFGLRDVIREILYVLSPFENIKRKLSDAEQISLASRVLALEPRLLIIDNFETVQEDELLYKFLEEFQSPSKALITSRLRINTGEKVVTLGGLAEKDAVKLLLFEADRLGIPIDEQDMARMRIISRKTFGIPFVLRWVMERIREGQTLEWAVESLEHATAKDIFVYIFNSSLSLLDPPTRKIFRSMALLSTWTSIETISAMNAEVAAIPDRLSDLVKYSLVEDNLKLAPGARRYQLHPFTRYLASQELLSIDDKGAHIAKNALRYYLNNLLTQKKVTPAIQEYLEMEFANIQEVVRFASTDVSHDLVDECIQVLKALKEVDLKKGMMLLPYLVEASRRTGNQKPALQLLGIIGNPYFSGTPVRDPSMFFGREDLLGKIQESFDRNPSSAIAITGPRRVGKTSLLYQLHSHWRDNHYWVHIDLQAFLLGEGIAPLLLGIIHEINDELNSRGIRDKEMSSQLIVDEVDFKRRPLLAFAHYIRNVHHFLGDAHLVLLFDEFDLISRFINEDSSGDFSNWLLYLRALVNEGALGIITAGVRPLIELVYDDELKGSPFFNIFTSIRMAAISRKSAFELIQRPMSGLLHYDNLAIEYILDLSGCIPFHLALICERIIHNCRLKGTLFIDRDFIEAIIPELYQLFSSVFSYYLNQLNDVEKEILLGAGQTRVGRQGSFTERVICELFPQYNSQKVGRALHSLESLGIFIIDKHGNYEFAGELLQRVLIEEITRRMADDSGHQVRSITNKKGASGMSDQKQDKPTVTNTTHIGYVAGPTHTGSGDIIIDALSYEGAISTKEEFLAALRAFKGELEVARQKGLPEEIYDDTTVEIEAAEREARKDASKPDRIINRLEKAKALLTEGAGVAAATTSLVETSSKLVPLIEATIHAVSKIFS